MHAELININENILSSLHTPASVNQFLINMYGLQGPILHAFYHITIKEFFTMPKLSWGTM